MVGNNLSEQDVRALQQRRDRGEQLSVDENKYLDNLEQAKPNPELLKNLQARKQNGEQLNPEEERQLSDQEKGSQPDGRPNKAENATAGGNNNPAKHGQR
jgi:hypothetical protein